MSTAKLRKVEETFSERLKALRKEHGLSQEDLAARLDVSPGSVGNWEIGPYEPHPKTLKRIGALFDVDVSYLLSGGKEAAAPTLRDKPSPYEGPDLPALLREVEDMRDRLDRIAQQLRKVLKPGTATARTEMVTTSYERRRGGSAPDTHETSDAQRLVAKAEGKTGK